MKLNQALKTKNRLTAEVTRLKEQMKEQNSRPVQQPFDYDTRELLLQLRAKIDQLVRVKGAIGKANGEIYEQIFRLAELRGAVALLKTVPTRHGKFLEAASFSQPTEVEYHAQMRQVDVDTPGNIPHYTSVEPEIENWTAPAMGNAEGDWFTPTIPV
jgi:hypothetical protein